MKEECTSTRSYYDKDIYLTYSEQASHQNLGNKPERLTRKKSAPGQFQIEQKPLVDHSLQVDKRGSVHRALSNPNHKDSGYLDAEKAAAKLKKWKKDRKVSLGTLPDDGAEDSKESLNTLNGIADLEQESTRKLNGKVSQQLNHLSENEILKDDRNFSRGTGNCIDDVHLSEEEERSRKLKSLLTQHSTDSCLCWDDNLYSQFERQSSWASCHTHLLDKERGGTEAHHKKCEEKLVTGLLLFLATGLLVALFYIQNSKYQLKF